MSSLTRTLAMLEAIIAEDGTRSVAAVARDLGIPVATAHRQVHSLVAEGYLARHVRGFHIAGPRLMSLLSRFDEKQIIANAAAPVLHQLAGDVGCVVQLGTLETEMVTYRIKTGAGADGLFTRVGMQWEAYCSGIGKVLLAALADREREDYLTGGPFPALTTRTIIHPEALRAELAQVREKGYAVDDEEAADGLYCISVPIHAPDGSVPAAISLSQANVQAKEPVLRAGLPMLRIAARTIEAKAFG